MSSSTRWTITLAVAPALWLACSPSPDPARETSTSGDASQSSTSAAGAAGAGGEWTVPPPSDCNNLECKQVVCPGNAKTSVSGTVFDPAGKTPLYNVSVYVPNAPVNALPKGVVCDQCGSMLSGSPLVTATTDTSGEFVLKDVPAGNDIPLVIQVGKWRRQIVLPVVEGCQDNPISDPELTSLPSSRLEGDIPKIALATGGADPLECLLRKVGLDDSEFTPESGAGSVNLFAGSGAAQTYAPSLNGGAALTQAETFWSDLATLKSYDVVLLACEGQPYTETKPQKALQALFDYAWTGGRVFLSHFHFYWLSAGPAPFQPIAQWYGDSLLLPDPYTALIDVGFKKGDDLAKWLTYVGASPVQGELAIHQARWTVASLNTTLAQRWLYGLDPPTIQYFTFNTPVPAFADEQCGRVVYTDLHVSTDLHGEPFPSGCVTSDLSPQEKVLLFMLFDLTACIRPDDPTPPAP